MQKDELLWGLYEDNRTFARFHENQRATVTALVAGGNVALIAAMIGNDGLGKSDWPFSLMTVLTSLLGLVISLKATEKLRRHNKRAAKFLQAMSDSANVKEAEALKKAVDIDHDNEHWFTSNFRQSTLWNGIHFVILMICGLVLVLIFINAETERPDWSFPSVMERTIGYPMGDSIFQA